jgi:hypothetical protein
MDTAGLVVVVVLQNGRKSGNFNTWHPVKGMQS